MEVHGMGAHLTKAHMIKRFEADECTRDGFTPDEPGCSQQAHKEAAGKRVVTVRWEDELRDAVEDAIDNEHVPHGDWRDVPVLVHASVDSRIRWANM
jgi:hypothetical protein